MPLILVADDEPGVRQFLRDVLESAGYEVSEAGNGREAMEQVRRRTFDLAIIDLVMPQQEGLETIRALKKEHPLLRIIAISGAFSDSERSVQLRMAELLGAKAILPKPLPVDAVLETVQRVLSS